jgi:hypothetical protein
MAASFVFVALNVNAVEIPVLDSSFEDLVREPSATTVGAREWTLPAWDSGAVGRFVQSPALVNQEGPDVGFIGLNGGGGAAWFIDTPVIEEGTYTATVALAHQAGREPATAPFKINFEAVGFGYFGLAGTNPFPVGTVDATQFTDVSANLVVSAGQEIIGKYLRLVLVMDNADVGADPGNPGARYLMDNVRLEFTPTGGEKRDVWLGESSFQPTAWHRPYTDGGDAGVYRPDAPLFANQDGDQLGFVTISSLGGFAALWQDHTTIQPGTYTLSANVGLDATALPVNSYLVLKFEAVAPGFKELIDEQSFIVPSELSATTLTEKTNVVVIEPDSPLIGKTLRSVLVAEGGELDHGTYFFDDVNIQFTPTPETLTADFNHDTFVDALDLGIWKSSYNQNGLADADGDGDSDGADFLAWQRQYTGDAVLSAVTQVPEPTSLVTLFSAIAMCGGLLKRR